MAAPGVRPGTLLTGFVSAYINVAPHFKEVGAIAPLPQHLLRLADLPPAGPARDFVLEPDAPARAALAEALDLPELRKFRFAATLRPEGARGWRLDGLLGATAIQTCVATLEPVTTRIDEAVTRYYSPDAPEAEPLGGEVEMPEDTDTEPLPETLDLYAVAVEALSLALPAFPRRAEAQEVALVVTEPGKTPMTDEAARPFAGLAGLRDKLGGGDAD